MESLLLSPHHRRKPAAIGLQLARCSSTCLGRSHRDVRFSYSSWDIVLGLGDDKFAEALVVFTPRWYAIDTFSNALCKLRPVCFPEIMTALKTNNKEFGDVYSRFILNVKIQLLTLFQYFIGSFIHK